MTVETMILAGRRLVDDTLIDEGTISRSGGAPVFDPVTGTYTPAVATVIYTGPCRIRMPALVERDVIFGEADVTKTRFIAVFRHDIPAVEIGDNITITESDDLYITLRTFRIEVVPSLSVLMYRKFGVEVAD